MNRGSLPAHLPRIEMVVDIDDHACPCCGNALHRIGEDAGERLDIVPAQFRVLVVRRPKYACRACENVVVQAPAPARLIEGGLPTEATVAQVLVSKYADHLPLYRQAQIYARQGIDARSLDLGRLGRPCRLHAAAGARAPARQCSRARPSCSPTRPRRRCSIRDAGAPRPASCGPTRVTIARGAAPTRPASPTSTRPIARPTRPIAHLAGFTGVLQVDGYAGYRVARRARRRAARLLLVACAPPLLRTRRGRAGADRQRGARTHRRTLRRREATSAAATPRSDAPSARSRSRPIIDDLEPWLRAKLALISQKTKLAEAIRYALSRWDGLTRFLDDGRIEIDSNVVERSIRPIALNRKNALFAGSDGGGEHWAVIASLIETCKLIAVEPHAYLTDVITKIVNGHPNSRIDELLPWAYRRSTRAQGRGLKTTLTLFTAIIAVVRQKLHLSTCSNLRSRLYFPNAQPRISPHNDKRAMFALYKMDLGSKPDL